MAKKHVTKQRIYQQRHRTETVRKEVVLNAAYPEDRAIIDFVNDLPRGSFSDVFRAAMVLYMEHIDNPPLKLSDEFAVWMDAVIDGIDELRQRPVMAAIYPQEPANVTAPRPTPAVVQSSGLDMSRPRPRPTLQPGKVVAPEADADVLPDNWREVFAKQMADSVKNAQPGRR